MTIIRPQYITALITTTSHSLHSSLFFLLLALLIRLAVKTTTLFIYNDLSLIFFFTLFMPESFFSIPFHHSCDLFIYLFHILFAQVQPSLSIFLLNSSPLIFYLKYFCSSFYLLSTFVLCEIFLKISFKQISCIYFPSFLFFCPSLLSYSCAAAILIGAGFFYRFRSRHII